MNKLVLLTALVAVAGCASYPQEPFDIDGSRADGTVLMGVIVGALDKVNWDGAHEKALIRCRAWGYTEVEPFSGYRSKCLDDGVWSGSCSMWELERVYQCGGLNAAKIE